MRTRSTPSNFIASLIAITLAALVYSPLARAEYRLFELAITNTKTGKTRAVVSNLDDIQYPAYYPLNADETIAIQDSWMCWKRSEYFKPFCPKPLRAPASLPTTSSAPAGASAPTAR